MTVGAVILPIETAGESPIAIALYSFTGPMGSKYNLICAGGINGTAFGKITTSLVNDVFMPLIGLLIGGVDLGQLNIVLKPEVLDEAGQVVTEAVTLGIGTFLSTVIDFVLVAFVIFLMVKTINQLHKLGKKDEEPQEEEEPTPTSEELLTEIRDLLKAQQK